MVAPTRMSEKRRWFHRRVMAVEMKLLGRYIESPGIRPDEARRMLLSMYCAPVNIDVADVVKFLGTAFERRGFFELL